ncbi:MAG: hypothetical protein JXN65_08075 [Clostridia bacterium]|nr:hypothetical protein [Clostridia bacterium]
MKKFMIIGSITIAVALGILIFATVFNPKIKTAHIITPTPFVATPEPTPTATPEILVHEEESQGNFMYLGFYSLLDIMTTSQYNYIMISTTEFFNSVYQADIRNYTFDLYKSQYEEMLDARFDFADDAALHIPYDRFMTAFETPGGEYKFLLNESSITEEGNKYKYTVVLYLNNEIFEEFYFVVDKKTSIIKIS